MDASTRSFNVYGKTEAGAAALKTGRSTLPGPVRRILILVDGQRTIGELTGILGAEAVTTGLAQLESQGYVEFLRRFPDSGSLPEASTTLIPFFEPLDDDAGPDELVAETPLSCAPLPAGEAPHEERHAAPAPRRTWRRARLWLAVLGASVLALATVGWLARHAAAPASPTAAGPAATITAKASGAASIAADGAQASASAPADPPPPLPLDSPPVAVPVPVSENPEFASAPAPAPGPAPAPAPAPPPAPPPAPAPAPLALPEPARAQVPVRAAAPAPAAGTTLHVRTQVAPEIPQAVRNRGITSGHVAVVLHVRPDGLVERVELLGASPQDVYDQAMMEAFAQWTFDPPGIPGRMTIDVDIRPPQ